MTISFIWAMDNEGSIGKNNTLPWRLPEDLKFFKETTLGHPIVMGRKTFESIGKPLPGRENIILTRDQNYQQPGCTVLHSVEDVIKLSTKTKELFITGGAEVFGLFLPYVDRLYVTKINETFGGDTFFPTINWNEWTLTSTRKGPKNEKNPYDYQFEVYERKEIE
ncbi:dihydrofolate reductase [Oikeobacillus pervagus]|uniref:Dihydrofolate reductase n=1 Tax=Oikeobacillus pervagus TaxID=1325931 RepID=A0AAJ1T5Z8_9BACI|nr:dihydrofolate reductase [Oikeobacillus pervagus]MDQ0215841.1 dihydrofolate reductase [Oikeobacillus pervagus]